MRSALLGACLLLFGGGCATASATTSAVVGTSGEPTTSVTLHDDERVPESYHLVALITARSRGLFGRSSAVREAILDEAMRLGCTDLFGFRTGGYKQPKGFAVCAVRDR